MGRNWKRVRYKFGARSWNWTGNGNIKATIEARKKNNLSQRDLSKKTGIKQPAIARIESQNRSPKISTLLKILYPMGYTLKVVPLKKKK